jgi:phage/plasmid-associated DNA primase
MWPDRAQKKYQQPFDFTNFAKLVFSANEIPQSDDKGYAYFRRWIIFVFDKVFQGKEKDTKLIEKLTTPEELSGLLDYALIALRKLIRDDGFMYIDDIDTIERTYRLNSSTVEKFLHDRCEVDTSNVWWTVVCRELYDEYVGYCIANDLNSISPEAFGSELAQSHIRRDRKRVKRQLEYCYWGVKVRENETLR